MYNHCATPTLNMYSLYKVVYNFSTVSNPAKSQNVHHVTIN